MHEEDERKKARRDKEQELQEQVVATRVRKVDDQGRAHGLGKRKTAVARVMIWANQQVAASSVSEGLEAPAPVIQVVRPTITVNGLPLGEYFRNIFHRSIVLEPFSVSGTHGKESSRLVIRLVGMCA